MDDIDRNSCGNWIVGDPALLNRTAWFLSVERTCPVPTLVSRWKRFDSARGIWRTDESFKCFAELPPDKHQQADQAPAWHRRKNNGGEQNSKLHTSLVLQISSAEGLNYRDCIQLETALRRGQAQVEHMFCLLGTTNPTKFDTPSNEEVGEAFRVLLLTETGMHLQPESLQKIHEEFFKKVCTHTID